MVNHYSFSDWIFMKSVQQTAHTGTFRGAWMFACVWRSRGDHWRLFMQRLRGSGVAVRT